MRRAVFGPFALLLLLTGCASSTVREPPAPLPDISPAFEVDRLWEADVGAGGEDYVGLVPRVEGDTVYVAGRQGSVSAYATNSGERRWEADLNTEIGGGVGVGEDLVAIGTRRGQVVALARDTGKQLWSAHVSSEVLAPPAVSGGMVVAQTVDGRLFGFAGDGGKRLWVHERAEPALSLRGTDTPVIVEDAVLAGFASGKLAVLGLKDGRLLWESTVVQPRGRNEIERLADVDVAPLVLPDAVYAAGYQGKLVAVNPRGGTVTWSRDVSTYTGLATDGVNIYVTDERGHVLAFDRQSGASVWKQEALRGRWLNAPVVHKGFVVVADFEGYVHWIDRSDGRLVTRTRAGRDPIRAPGVVADDMLFVASTSGTLFALRPAQK